MTAFLEAVIFTLQPDKLLRIGFVLLTGLFSQRVFKSLLRKITRKIQVVDQGKLQQENYRIKTLQGVINSTGALIIWTIVVVTVLSELGVNIGPLVAGAGIVGFGIAFGSQTLVRDFIGGFFILLENQYNQGDTVEISGKKGRVEQINLRTTILKDEEGNIHIIPNSQIHIVTRLTAGREKI